ncbi:GNAT family N-acetyltransferase [Propioniciclava soli]|uniref:GNAT family N-acetyltransferase n=1 Tax=Propioniciclava soli TaxID=2775081 RepID=UPI001E4DDA46
MPHIRQATPLDLHAMAVMKDAAWCESYADLLPADVLAGLSSRRPGVVAHWESRMLDGGYFWVAEDAAGIAGLSHAGAARDAEAGIALELEMLYLLDRVKGTGLGQALLHTTIGDADAYLWVLEGNERAIAFYRREGFVPDGGIQDVRGLPGIREIRMVRRAGAEAD